MPVGNLMEERHFCAIGSIDISIPNMATLEDSEGQPRPLSSPVHTVGEFAWRAEVHKVVKDENEPPKLDLYVYCNEDVRDKLWLCKVFFSVHSEVQDLPGSGVSYAYHQFYGFNTYYWILLDIFEPKEAQMGNVHIKLDIKVCRTAQRSLPALDTNLLIKLADTVQIVPVNKHSLAGHSAYFRNLFFEDWNDKKVATSTRDGNQFEIQEDGDFDMEAFKFMVYSALTMGWMVHESNFMDYTLANEIVKLGLKYDMGMLVDYAEKYLMDLNNHSKMNLLEVAEQYNLAELREHCIKEVDPLEFMADMQRSMEIFAKLAKSTQDRLSQQLSEKGKELKKKVQQMEKSGIEGGGGSEEHGEGMDNVG